MTSIRDDSFESLDLTNISRATDVSTIKRDRKGGVVDVSAKSPQAGRAVRLRTGALTATKKSVKFSLKLWSDINVTVPHQMKALFGPFDCQVPDAVFPSPITSSHHLSIPNVAGCGVSYLSILTPTGTSSNSRRFSHGMSFY